MRHAIVDSKTKKVLNVIVWDGISPWTPPSGTTLKQHDEVGMGDIWHEETQDFLRPLKNLRPPLNELDRAERYKQFTEAKDKLKSQLLHINPNNELEA